MSKSGGDRRMIVNKMIVGGGWKHMRVVVDATPASVTIGSTLAFFAALVPDGTTAMRGIWRPVGHEDDYTQETGFDGHNGEFFALMKDGHTRDYAYCHTRFRSSWTWQTPSGAYDSRILVGDVYDLYYTDDPVFSAFYWPA